MRLATLMWATFLAGTSVALAACGGKSTPPEIREYTDDLAFRISAVPAPPVAEEMTVIKVVVLDKTTGQPIQNGQGRVFATSQEHAQASDGLTKGQEVGTYYAHIRFPVSGDWAFGLQFRRDSASKLERTQDWQQEILPAPPLGQKSDTTNR